MLFTFLTVLVPFLCIFQAGTLVQNSLFALFENSFLKTIPKGNGVSLEKANHFRNALKSTVQRLHSPRTHAWTKYLD